MRNFLLLIVALLDTEFGGLVQAQERPVVGCFNPYGRPGGEACVDYHWKVCRCVGWRCSWSCPLGGCSDECVPKNTDVSVAGGCSDPSDLDMDLRAELDSPVQSCEFPCNCIASGNQIGHKLGVKTPTECDSFCKSYPKYCKFWTLIKSKGICFALTNCNYPKCGAPFNYYYSGPVGCPPSTKPKGVSESTFTVTNLVRNRNADGTTSFQGNTTEFGGCLRTYGTLAFGQIQTLTFPTSCLPVITITASLNGGIICDPFVGLEKDPQNVVICANANSRECYVSMNKPCK